MAIRFSKQYHTSWNSSTPSVEMLGGVDYYLMERRFSMPIAPARYSSIRKVAFHISVVNTNATIDANVRFRVGIGTLASAPRTNPNIVSVPAETYQVGTSTPLGAGSFVADMIFDRIGASALLPSDATRGGPIFGSSQVLTIEFDLFDPADADFFTAWLAPAGVDEFIEFVALMEVPDGVTPVGVLMINFGITTIQAPSPNNRTVTYLCAEDGRSVTGSGRQDFDSTLPFPAAGAGEARRAGLYRFRFLASDWNGLTGVHFHIMTGSKGNTGDLLFRLVEITDDDPPTTITIFTETVDVTSSQHGFYRTKNFLSLLEDGKDYAFDWRHSSPSAQAGGNSGDQMCCWEIIQRQCSRTVAYFEPRPQVTPFILGGVTPKHPYEAAAFFDPLFFEDMPDDFFSKQQIIGGLLHQTVALNPEQALYINPLLTQDGNAFPPDGISPTTQRVSPTIDDSPTLVSGWKYKELTLTANDPLTLAGVRKIHWFVESGAWDNVGGNDHPGMQALKYVHFVPETETPELGPLFPLGAFNPEGCASTSAGLGDQPGLLVITNGSTIPKHFNPLVPIIEDNGVPVPFCDEVPSTVVEDTGASPTSGLGLGIYTYRYTLRNCCTLKESDPNPDDIVVNTASASPAAKVTLSFAGVRIPGDPQICQICIYRTVLGGDFPVMAKVGCFDPLLTTLFVDDVADAVLDFINDGLSLLNGPMPCVPVVAEFRNRLFGLGDIPDLSPAGTVTVVEGSDIVEGDEDVEWDRCLEGKFIQVEGDCRFYEIDKVLPPESGLSPPIGRLKLTDEYEGTDDTMLNYILCGRPNRLYISEPLEPECWPAANFLDVEPGDGDHLIGAVSNFNRLVICKRNKTYVLTFHEQPAIEVVVPTRISSDIGCIGPRTFAQIESGSVWLSDRGLAIYDGRSVRAVPESEQMNNMFIDPDNPRYVRRDSNGRVIGAVGVFYPKREQYLLLLPTVQTVRGANLMLVWDIKLKNITLLQFCQEFQSMVVAKDSDGNQRVYLGDTNGFVWIYDIGDNDGVGFPNQVGTVTGTVSDAGVEAVGASFLDDDTASFIEGGLPVLAGLSGTVGLSGAVEEGDLGMAGACLFTRRADAALDDPWIVRQVFAATETRLFVTPSWGVDTPSVGDDYMIGAIQFVSVFKPSNYGTDDFPKRDWRQVVTHLPESVASVLRVELLPDFFNSDPEELTVLNGDPPEPGQGRIFDLSFNKGRQVRPVGRLIHNYQAIRMSNFAPEQPMRILNHSLMTTPKQSR